MPMSCSDSQMALAAGERAELAIRAIAEMRDPSRRRASNHETMVNGGSPSSSRRPADIPVFGRGYSGNRVADDERMSGRRTGCSTRAHVGRRGVGSDAKRRSKATLD